MNEELLKRVNPGILGIKPYVPGRSIRSAQRERKNRSYIKLASNENPLGISPAAAKAVEGILQEGHQYPEPTGPDLTAALAGKLEVPPEYVFLGNGADGVLYNAGMALIDQDDQVIIPDITFSLYEIIARAMRGQVLYSGMKNYAIDLDDILARVTPRTKLVFICNPNNPTGIMIPRRELAAFLEALPERVFVIHDEVYFDFAPQESFPDLLETIRRGSRRLIVTRSFSKIYGLAGVRIGYAVACPELVGLMYRVRPPFDVSLLALAAGRAALGDETFYRQTLDMTLKEKEIWYQRLRTLGLPFIPSNTNFVLIDLGPRVKEITDRLLDEGIIVRSGLSPKMPTHIRVTVGTREQNEKLLQSLERLIA